MRLKEWIAAALGVATALGGPALAEEPEPPAAGDEGEGSDLASSPRWRRTAGVWHEAELIASGQKLVDAKARARVLAELAASLGQADAIAKAGKLSPEEHSLVRKDLIDLIAALNALASAATQPSAPAAGAKPELPRPGAKAGPSRPGTKAGPDARSAPPRPQITCYGPRRIDYDRSVREVGMRLAARLPLLRKLVASKRLQPAVVARLIVSLRGDAAYLEVALAGRGLAPEIPARERVRLRKLARDVKAAIARLERSLR